MSFKLQLRFLLHNLINSMDYVDLYHVNFVLLPGKIKMILFCRSRHLAHICIARTITTNTLIY